MPGSLRRRSRVLLVSVAGVVSIATGLVLVFRLFRVEMLDALPTTILYAVLGLLLLPVFAAWAFWMQRSLAARATAVQAARQAVVSVPATLSEVNAQGEATDRVIAGREAGETGRGLDLDIPGRHADASPGRRSSRTPRAGARLHEPAGR